MSWEKFSEFKSFAKSQAGSSRKRQKQGAQQSGIKRRKTSNDHRTAPHNIYETSIDTFSSEEEGSAEINAMEQNKERMFAVIATKKNASCDTHKSKDDGFQLLVDIASYDSDNNNTPLSAGSPSAPIIKKNTAIPVEDKAGIDEFDSDSEESRVQSHGDKTSSEEFILSTPHYSPTPPSKNMEAGPSTPRTGSEWLKHVQPLTSPLSQSVVLSPDGKGLLDSAKKSKKKFIRSGLAERLQRIINREKSDRTFWQHKLSDQKMGAQAPVKPADTLAAQVLSHAKQYSLHLTRCCILSEDGSSCLQPTQLVDVVFNSETFQQLRLGLGVVVRIHPPWQRLEVQESPYPILLCTYRCERIHNVSPLMADLTLLPEAQLPCLPHGTSSPSSHKEFQPAKLLFGQEDCNPDKEDGATVTPRVRGEERPLSIMEGIELRGGCSGGFISFEAVVQRVYRKRVRIARNKLPVSPGQASLRKSLITCARSGEDREEIRPVLLVQDHKGTFCEIQLSSDWSELKNNDWSGVLASEGKLFKFSDLKILQRINRARSPGLFSLIDSLWKDEDGRRTGEWDSLPLSSEDNPSGKLPLPPPCCCYVLAVQACSRTVSSSFGDEGSMYKPPLLSNLSGLPPKDATDARVSTWCRVLCMRRSQRGETQSSWTGAKLTVTDASLHRAVCRESRERYVTVDLRHSCALLKTVREAAGKMGTLLFLKDLVVAVEKGETSIYADSFSDVKKASPGADVNMADSVPLPPDVYKDLMSIPLMDSIPPLSQASSVGSLCRVEGIVLGVDEETACCWLECADCGSADLVERTGLPYYCAECQINVQSPLTKTNLEVYLECEPLRESRVRIKLLQTTVAKLLPVSYQDSEQGYDIERVLGKRLGPLYCNVEHTAGPNTTLQEVHMDI
ncbi:DNA repair-scaffolding protein isoform X2 [Nematostella vectensis]|uniref:DNA repair-scaffolding protein isoform X2 n=1 Tax=Nematostella vectensis TaxID=45351 RepID=UPI0013905CEE|nr:DNA repair-scaffolding protein isoform X2 [Nematostella vectensis]